MPSPAWPCMLLAAALAVATCYHARRLLVGIRSGHLRLDVDLTHILMGLAMTAMLLEALPRSSEVWLVAAFTPAALWFAVVAVRRYVFEGPGQVGRETVHAVGCAAMAYMLAPAAGLRLPSATAASVVAPVGTATPHTMAGMAMPGMGAALGGPVLAGALLAAVSGAALWTVWHTRRYPGGPAAVGCQVAMNAAAAYMLVAVL